MFPCFEVIHIHSRAPHRRVVIVWCGVWILIITQVFVRAKNCVSLSAPKTWPNSFFPLHRLLVIQWQLLKVLWTVHWRMVHVKDLTSSSGSAELSLFSLVQWSVHQVKLLHAPWISLREKLNSIGHDIMSHHRTIRPPNASKFLFSGMERDTTSHHTTTHRKIQLRRK